MKQIARMQAIIAVALITSVGGGCTAAVYHHAFITKYDANMKVIGYEEVESVTQQDPTASSLRVKIEHPGEIEK